MADDASSELSETRQRGVSGEEGDDDDRRLTITTTLPMREGSEGWPYPLFRLHGCWLTEWHATSIQLVQAQFKPRADDVLVATFPKCGTTWLKALAFAVLNRSRHPVVVTGAGGGGNHPLLHTNPHGLVPFLEMPNRRLYPVAELEALPSPRLLCTHAPPALLPAGTLLTARAVYLCREPKDVFVSLWHHIQTVRRRPELPGELDEAFAHFCEGVSVFGPVWEHYLEYWKLSVANPSRVLFLRYEEMVARPGEHVRRLAEFLRVPFTEEEEESGGAVEAVVRLCSFRNLKHLPVNAHGEPDRNHDRLIKNSLWFRKGEVGDWENHLTLEMARKLDCIVEEKLKGSGLTF